MIKTGHLGEMELFALCVIVAASDLFLTVPQQLVIQGGTAGWMIPLASMAICLAGWFLVKQVFEKASGKDGLFLGNRFLGKWVALIALVPIILFVVLDASNTLRLFSETVVTTMLPKSPISFVAIPFLLVIVFAAYKGVEGLSRLAWVVIPWVTLGVILLLVLNGNWMNLEYVFPLMGRGFPRLASGSVIYTGLFMNFLFLPLLAFKLRDPSSAVKIGFWSILAVGITYSAVTLVFLLVFPQEAAMRAPFPLYQLSRLIYVGRFLQRLEAAFIVIWVAMAVIKMSFQLWIASYLFANATKMPMNRPLVFPFALIFYSLAFIPASLPETLMYSSLLLRLSGLMLVGLPFITLLWMRFRLRKERSGNEQARQVS